MNTLVALAFFLGLTIAHLIGDWLVQTEFQAVNKDKGGMLYGFLNVALLTHCAVYTLIFVPVFFVFSIPNTVPFLAVIFTTHLLLDKRVFVIGWCKHIKRTQQETIKNLFWLVIAVDQVFHFLVLCGIFLTVIYPSIKTHLTLSFHVLK